MRWLPVFLLFSLSQASLAADDSPVQLKVKPVLCIIDARTPSCQMSFLVIWQSAESGYYCLYNDFGDVPVRCWTDESAGEVDDERNVQSAFNYWMTGDDGQARLAVVSVEVLRMDSDDRRRRRRGRHVWDIL
ncbi:MAG: DUF3019 domain-containing protein [Woeseiaceae bacterium]